MLAPIDVTTITVSSHTLDITVSYLATLVYIVYYIYLFPAVGIITLPILSAMVSHYLFQWAICPVLRIKYTEILFIKIFAWGIVFGQPYTNYKA